MSKKNETQSPKIDSAPLPSLTDAELTQVLGGIGRPDVYTRLRRRAAVK